MSRTLLPALLLALAALWAPSDPVRAQSGGASNVESTHPAEGVSFAEAVGRAESDPLVGAAGQAHRIGRDGQAELGALSDPLVLSLSGGMRQLEGGDRGPDLGVSVSQRLAGRAVAGARRRQARRESELAGHRRDRLDLDARLRNAERWIDAWRAGQRWQLWKEQARDAEEGLELAQRAFDARLVTRAALSQRRAEAAQVHGQEHQAEGEWIHSGWELALALDPAASRPAATQGRLPAPALPDQRRLAFLETRLDRLPALREGLAKVSRSRADAQLARARAGWATQLSAGATREHPGDWIAGLTLSVELPRANRSLPARTRARAEATLQEGRYQRDLTRARATYRQLLHELGHSQERIEALVERELPALREAEADLVELGDMGESTRVEGLQLRSLRRDAQLRLIDAQAEHAWVRVQLHLIWNEVEAER